MRYLLCAFLLSLSSSSLAVIDPAKVPWVASLKDAKVFFFNVCGSADIMPNQGSLVRDFALGPKKEGYFFTDALGLNEYRALIYGYSLEEAKKELKERFEKTHLWKYSTDGLQDLGVPTKMDFPFVSTVKDCMAGAKNSLGYQCQENQRKACCSEKFAGPIIFWGAQQEHILKYSPDPSVKLKIPNEKKNRFCNFQQRIEVQGSGR